jgi:hypothetical protein
MSNRIRHAIVLALLAPLATAAAAEEPIRLVIRGDDLGMTQGSLTGVAKCFDEGVLTSTSIIVPSPWFEAAAALCRERPQWCAGIHLCLFGEWSGYRWRPVLPYDRVPTLVDEDGYLFPHPRQLFARKPRIEEIEAELRAQVALALKRGVKVAYLDTHMMGPSDRTYPGLGKAIRRIAREHGLPVSSLLGEGRFGVDAEPFETKTERAIEKLEALGAGLWLWVEHPGIASPEQDALRVPFDPEQPPLWVARDRAAVTAMLTDPRLKEVIRRRGIQLVDYRALGEEARRARRVEFETAADRLEVLIGSRPAASYVFKDARILRPYFAHVRAPGGIPVTRAHPPRPGVDAEDHAEMHPGIWLAFGSLGGADFWRNRGRVEHARFVEAPEGGDGEGRFAVVNRYLDGDRLVCEEECRVRVLAGREGFVLAIDSSFRSEAADLVFGDQQEMGFGVRLATPLTVKAGGRIIDSEGRAGEKAIWGREAAWCAADGVFDGRRAGVALFPHPENFRRSRFHARDYGLLAANPFGVKDFGAGDESVVTVKRGEPLRLRFAAFVYAVDEKAAFDIAGAAGELVEWAERRD